MKNKTGDFFRKCLISVIAALMGVQIVLGIAWLVMNFGSVQSFQESVEFEKISSSFLLDEYSGVLYPVILAVCRGAEKITSVPYPCFMEGLQLVMAFAAEYYLLGRLHNTGKYKRFFGVCFLMTVPFLMQMQLAILPYSLALSATLWMIGSSIAVLESGEKNVAGLTALGISYLTGSLLLPDLFWLGGVYLLVILLICLKKSHRQMRSQVIPLLLTLVLGMGIFQGINAIAVVPGSHGKIQNSFQAAMVDRFVWPNFATNYYFWSEDVKNVMSLDDAIYICRREDAVADQFGPMLEKAYGRQKANTLYLQMARRCFTDRTKECLEEIGTDFTDYLFIPASIEGNLRGHGTSETAWNYGKMRTHTPALTMIYCQFGLYAWAALMICSVILLIARLIRVLRCQTKEDQNITRYGFGILYVLICTIWYTMRSNSPVDYKLVLPTILFWYVFAISGFLTKKEE